MHYIDEIRRKAMGVLEKEAGGPVAAAKQAGMSHTVGQLEVRRTR